MRFRGIIVGLVLTTTAVGAWQYEDEFTLDQVGARPGGGGNWSTGGKQENRVTCQMCHVTPDAGFAAPITVQVLFSPAMGVATDGGAAYARNATYDVTINLVGEHLGTAKVPNHNMMAATFENAAGQYVGRLRSDTGFSKGGNCPATITAAIFNAYDAGATTVTQAGCNAITGRTRGPGVASRTSWKFQWTAPDAGQVLMYWGVTDGDSDESTVGDDTREGITTLE